MERNVSLLNRHRRASSRADNGYRPCTSDEPGYYPELPRPAPPMIAPSIMKIPHDAFAVGAHRSENSNITAPLDHHEYQEVVVIFRAAIRIIGRL